MELNVDVISVCHLTIADYLRTRKKLYLCFFSFYLSFFLCFILLSLSFAWSSGSYRSAGNDQATALRGRDGGRLFIVAIARAVFSRPRGSEPTGVFFPRFQFFSSLFFSFETRAARSRRSFRSGGPINIIKATGRFDRVRFIKDSICIGDNRRHRARKGC